RLAVELLDHVPGARALDLEAPADALHRLAHRPARRTRIVDDLDVVLALLGLEHQPVGGRRAADVNELVLGQVEDDAVADHVAVRRRRHVLLGLVDFPALTELTIVSLSSLSASGPLM